MAVKVKRVYEPAAAADGLRVLVDRLWPRGLAKASARVDRWARELSPSDALRKWYGHEPKKWPEFKRRYRAELAGQGEALRALAAQARGRRVTLLFGSKEPRLNNAYALKGMLESRNRRATPAKRTRAAAAPKASRRAGG